MSWPKFQTGTFRIRATSVTNSTSFTRSRKQNNQSQSATLLRFVNLNTCDSCWPPYNSCQVPATLGSFTFRLSVPHNGPRHPLCTLKNENNTTATNHYCYCCCYCYYYHHHHKILLLPLTTTAIATTTTTTTTAAAAATTTTTTTTTTK